MLQRELAKKVNLKLIEQLPNGEYLVRYAFYDDGWRIRFTCSQYPEKPSMDQIERSFYRILASIKDETISNGISNGFDLTDYSVIL